jgi:hypothetical protein
MSSTIPPFLLLTGTGLIVRAFSSLLVTLNVLATFSCAASFRSAFLFSSASRDSQLCADGCLCLMDMFVTAFEMPNDMLP